MALGESFPLINERARSIEDMEKENPVKWDSVPKKVVLSDTYGNELPMANGFMDHPEPDMGRWSVIFKICGPVTPGMEGMPDMLKNFLGKGEM